MSTTISVEEAQAKLPEIIRGLGPGEEGGITQGDHPVAQLRPVGAKPQPQFGSCKGMLAIAAEDEEHRDDTHAAVRCRSRQAAGTG